MHSNLVSFLKEKIFSRKDRAITFDEFMDACLYHPRFGYYMRPQPKIGKEGDYYTSSSVHPVFAETLAHFTVEVFERWQKPFRFCELGAGTGRFAKQFLDALAAHAPHLYREAEYLLVEKSPYHRAQQQEHLQNHREHIRWLDVRQDEQRFTGMLFSNELFDAFPVHIIEQRKGELFEVGVTWDEDEETFAEVFIPLTNEHMLRYLRHYGFQLVDGQRFEVPLAAEDAFREISRWMAAGLWLTVDYGYTNEELMLPQYRRGSLLCYSRHRADDRPLEQPGEKDMTAHVHFDVLSAVAEGEGWQRIGLLTQAEFLMRAGILELLVNADSRDPFSPAARKNRAIRQLITPQGMGGAFHVLTLGKGVPEDVAALLKR